MPDRKFVCCVDPRQMKRVLVHLIRNAVEAMEQGGQLAIEVATETEQLRIAVRDSGIGIPDADLQRAADPFYTTKTAGTGVGLALVTRVVHDHGGTMSIRRRNSGGTEVLLVLPL
jgi:signal transduction histidine kinase